MARAKALEDELRALKAAGAADQAADLAAAARDGAVVARVDGLDPGALRALALAVRDRQGVEVVVLGGSPDGERVALVAAVAKQSDRNAGELIAAPARTVGGGAGRQPDVATAGGKLPGEIDAALAQVRAELGG
jgi:alanyl-tRNA synthetase